MFKKPITLSLLLIVLSLGLTTSYSTDDSELENQNEKPQYDTGGELDDLVTPDEEED